jgi:hypothetical protein
MEDGELERQAWGEEHGRELKVTGKGELLGHQDQDPLRGSAGVVVVWVARDGKSARAKKGEGGEVLWGGEEETRKQEDEEEEEEESEEDEETQGVIQGGGILPIVYEAVVVAEVLVVLQEEEVEEGEEGEGGEGVREGVEDPRYR